MSEDSKEFDKVLSQIKKLLSLAGNNPNQHEAELAASRAAKLMNKHNIAMADVIAEDIKSHDSSIVDESLCEWTYKTKFPAWVTTLAINLTEVFDCKVRLKYIGKGANQIEILGYKSDVQIAKYVYAYLSDVIYNMAEKAWSELDDFNKTIHSQISWKRDYKWGLAVGLKVKIQELYKPKEVITSSGSSLVVLKQEAIEAKYGVVEYNTIKRDVSASFHKGKLDADKINLNKAMTDNQEESELLESESNG